MKKLNKTEIARSLVMIPFMPLILLAGIMGNDVEGMMEYYYPMFFRK